MFKKLFIIAGGRIFCSIRGKHRHGKDAAIRVSGRKAVCHPEGLNAVTHTASKDIEDDCDARPVCAAETAREARVCRSAYRAS
jgi:hypothetical protein